MNLLGNMMRPKATTWKYRERDVDIANTKEDEQTTALELFLLKIHRNK